MRKRPDGGRAKLAAFFQKAHIAYTQILDRSTLCVSHLVAAPELSQDFFKTARLLAFWFDDPFRLSQLGLIEVSQTPQYMSVSQSVSGSRKLNLCNRHGQDVWTPVYMT